MVSTCLALLSLLRSLLEVAGCALLGQAVLALLAGRGVAANPIYQLFQIVTRPPLQAVRYLAPAAIPDRHIPKLTFLLLFSLWILLAYVKQRLWALL